MTQQNEPDPDRPEGQHSPFGPPPTGSPRAAGGGPGGRPPTRGGLFGGGRIGPTVLVVIGLLMATGWLARLWTDFLWFTELGYRDVLTTRLLTQAVLFLGAGGLSALLVWSSLWLAYRHRPVYAPTSPEQENLDRYRAALEPVRRLVFVGVPVVLGLFAGSAAAAQWQTVLLWLNRQPFGETDPEFGIDIGFYVFTVPWLEVLISFATLILGLAVIAALLTHYVYGGLQLQGPGQRTTPQARVHLAVLLAALIAVRGLAYWLERYTLMTTEHARITGMTYTDVNAVLPTRGVLAIAALLCAAFFVATIWTKAWRLPIIGLVGLVVIAVVVGGIYPSLIQSLRVRPSEAALEEPYIQRAIDATLRAYQIEDAEVQSYNAETEASPGQLRDDAATIPGIRIVDPSIVSPTFRQLQGVRNYYQFPDALDVDRYEIDGETVDTVVAVRELNLGGVSQGQRNWVNDHTVYTHGFGLVAAYGNQRSRGGEPIFYQRNIPPQGPLGDFEPRIYFGEYSPNYSIVGAPEGTTPQELDFPDSESETGETRNTYEGDGGVPMGTTARRLAYAIKYRQIEIMLSEQVNSESRILDHREPRERVERVAPWLRLDGNPYPAVVGDRVKWIVDGYTVSAEYPYSQMQQLGDVTTDALVTGAQNVRSIGQGDVNYIRNSVKATVDAFDGSVDLYAWEEDDPVLQAWSSAFEGTVQPMSAVSGDLMSHLRYPEDMFKVQREVMSRYHVESAAAFFGGQDFWQVSEDPSASGDGGRVAMPPYYLSISMPGQEEPTFSLTSTYIPQGERQNLVGYMAVDADAGGDEGERREGYGTVRLLELPRDTTVMGPGQFQNEIESSNVNSEAFAPTLSQFLSLNRQQESNVQIGNLLTLPVGGGLLYVEPIYVSAATETSFPLQRAVVVAFGNDLAWSDTLDGALDELFGGDSGATAPDEGTGTEEPIDPGEDPGGEPGDEEPGDGAGEDPQAPDEEPTGDLADAIEDIQQAYEEGQEALRQGDWSGYAEAQERLQEAIERAMQAQPEGGSVSVTPGDDAQQTESP